MTTTHRAATATRDLAERLPELQAALEQQRQFRLEQLSELAEASANSRTVIDDVHDQVAEVLATSAAKALTEVEAALGRVRTGRYGICERCTEPIIYERLEILPMSRYCMDCQHAHEMESG
jgi:DnaK suppressor protein